MSASIGGGEPHAMHVASVSAQLDAYIWLRLLWGILIVSRVAASV